MKKSTACLLSALCLFFGVTLGFLLSPVKHGVEIGNNSRNRYFPKKD